MTLYDLLLDVRKDMNYDIKRIIGEILKEAFINDNKVPNVIKLQNVNYVSAEELNCFLKKLGIKVTSVEVDYPLAKRRKWKSDLTINMENDSRIGFTVL